MSRIVSRGPFQTRPRGAELWRHGPTDGNPTPAQWNGDGGNSAPFPPPFARRRRMSRSCARRHLERASRPLADALAGSRVLAHVGKTRVLMDEPHDAQGMTQRLQFALRGSKRSVRIDGVFVIVEMNSPRGTVAPYAPAQSLNRETGFLGDGVWVVMVAGSSSDKPGFTRSASKSAKGQRNSPKQCF